MPKHRSARGRATATAPPRLYAIEMVDARTGAAHLVTDEAVAEGRRHGGLYAAVCGRQVLGASLTDPGTGRCRSCHPIPSR